MSTIVSITELRQLRNEINPHNSRQNAVTYALFDAVILVMEEGRIQAMDLDGDRLIAHRNRVDPPEPDLGQPPQEWEQIRGEAL